MTVNNKNLKEFYYQVAAQIFLSAYSTLKKAELEM